MPAGPPAWRGVGAEDGAIVAIQEQTADDARRGRQAIPHRRAPERSRPTARCRRNLPLDRRGPLRVAARFRRAVMGAECRQRDRDHRSGRDRQRARLCAARRARRAARRVSRRLPARPIATRAKAFPIRCNMRYARRARRKCSGSRTPGAGLPGRTASRCAPTGSCGSSTNAMSGSSGSPTFRVSTR